MFRISRRLDYGLQLMIALASEAEGRPQATAVLAEKLQIPLPFMHQIGHTLMQAGLIKASPGPRGGLRLNKSAEEITALQVLEVLEGPVCLNPCLDCVESCPRQGNCASQFMWADLQEKIVAYLSGIRLSALVEQAQDMPLYDFSLADGTLQKVLN